MFGLIVGWIIGTQQAPARPFAPAAAPVAQAPAGAPLRPRQPSLDEAQAAALRNIAEKDPANVQSRVQLGNMYFDAERYQDAIQWYEAALKLNPNDVSVSTDLGVCFYYTNQPDRAIRQMEESLRIDPRHAKTLLNLGIVKAFGKQDLGRSRRRVGRGHQARTRTARKRRRPSVRSRTSRPRIPAARRCRRRARRRPPRPRSPAVPASSGPDPAHAGAFPHLVAAACSSSGGPCGSLLAGIVQGASAPPPPQAGPPEKGELMVRDPVCGTFVLPSRAVSLKDRSGTHHFCSDRCRQAYQQR